MSSCTRKRGNGQLFCISQKWLLREGNFTYLNIRLADNFMLIENFKIRIT